MCPVTLRLFTRTIRLGVHLMDGRFCRRCTEICAPASNERQIRCSSRGTMRAGTAAHVSCTTVLGTHRGALPEIITPEVGALRDTLDDLVEASRTIATRSSEACRAHATRYFTHITMAEEYVRVYHHLIANGALPPGRPTS